jgi:hypothetical protein
MSRPFAHIEIPVKNPQQDSKFYEELFGWKMQHVPPPMDYTMFETGNVGGGFPKFDESYQAGSVVVYIQSEDIDADLKRIEEKGGKTVMPCMEVKGWGWLAMFTDPSGNRLALWKSVPRG